MRIFIILLFLLLLWGPPAYADYFKCTSYCGSGAFTCEQNCGLSFACRNQCAAARSYCYNSCGQGNWAIPGPPLLLVPVPIPTPNQ